MNKTKSVLIITMLSFILPFYPLQIFAEQPAEEAEQIVPKDLLEEELLLLLPVETDNPNLTLIFADPSGEGIQLKIDAQDYSAIESPYILPSLAIGSHKLTFKFTDGEEVEQEIEKTLIIVPRAPVINPPEDLQDNKLTLNGTSISLSSVKIFLTGATKSFTAEVETNTSGEWEYVFEEDFTSGVYTTVAFSKKNGFASSYSEPVIFSLGDETVATTETENRSGDISFDFRDLSRNNLISVIQQNPHLGFLAVSAFIIGLLLSTITGFITGLFGEKRFEKSFRKQLSKAEKTTPKKSPDNKTDGENKKVSLRGKFEAAGFKADSYIEKKEEGNDSEEDLPEESQKTKEMSKEEFLSKFKDHDPDSTQAAKPSKQKKKKKASKAIKEPENDEKKQPETEEIEKESSEEAEVKEKSEEKETEGASSKIKFSLSEEDDDSAAVKKEKETPESNDKKKPGDKRSQLEKSIKITLTSNSLGD